MKRIERTPIVTGRRIVRFPEVLQRVPYCKQHIYTLIAQGKFPRGIKLGANARGWLDTEIDEWIATREAA